MTLNSRFSFLFFFSSLELSLKLPDAVSRILKPRVAQPRGVVQCTYVNRLCFLKPSSGFAFFLQLPIVFRIFQPSNLAAMVYLYNHGLAVWVTY